MSTKISEDYIFDDSIYSFLGIKFVPRHPPLSWQENFCSSPPPTLPKFSLPVNYYDGVVISILMASVFKEEYSNHRLSEIITALWPRSFEFIYASITDNFGIVDF